MIAIGWVATLTGVGSGILDCGCWAGLGLGLSLSSGVSS